MSRLTPIAPLTIVLLALALTGCRYESLADFIDENHFERTMSVGLTDGQTTLSVDDRQGVLAAARGAVTIEPASCEPTYTISLFTSSSLRSQAVDLALCDTRDGFVLYKGKQVLSFHSPELFRIADERYAATACSVTPPIDSVEEAWCVVRGELAHHPCFSRVFDLHTLGYQVRQFSDRWSLSLPRFCGPFDVAVCKADAAVIPADGTVACAH